MFDILQFLYDNYLADDDHYPDPASLSRKLLAAGFEQQEIDDALAWLDGLEGLKAENAGEFAQRGLRHYQDIEAQRLAPEGRGFLMFLENAGLLSPQVREWVIERALALDDPVVSAEKIKWITLLALWRVGGPMDALWLEDLVRGDEDGFAPTLH